MFTSDILQPHRGIGKKKKKNDMEGKCVYKTSQYNTGLGFYDHFNDWESAKINLPFII